MRNSGIIAVVVTVISVMILVALFSYAIGPDRHYSDPAVYERYVEDMRRAGRKPNGEPLEPGTKDIGDKGE